MLDKMPEQLVLFHQVCNGFELELQWKAAAVDREHMSYSVVG